MEIFSHTYLDNDASISKLLYSWLFIDPSEHHPASKFNAFLKTLNLFAWIEFMIIFIKRGFTGIFCAIFYEYSIIHDDHDEAEEEEEKMMKMSMMITK